MITGSTRAAAVIGDPVRHSLSPLLHNTAYEAMDLDWCYVAFEVPAGATGAALDAARTLGLVGVSVTMPHKTAAADACDELTADAAALHSVNTVTVFPDGRLHGDSTDGEGFLRALADAGVDVDGASVLLLGAGGAGRAVRLACERAGARVRVAARRPELATVPWSERDDAAADTDIVVNATPVGMGDGAMPLDPAGLRPGQVVVDLVYHPIETPLLAAARAAGAVVVDGLGMLVHQAALQVERWAARPAPVRAMRAAVADVLA